MVVLISDISMSVDVRSNRSGVDALSGRSAGGGGERECDEVPSIHGREMFS